MKKAVFFDIDGTLWDRQMHVPESTVNAIRRLRENGSYAFICSGRTRSNISTKELMEAVGFDGIIAGCGTHIEYQGKTVFEKRLTKEGVNRFLSVSARMGLPVVLEGPSCLYADIEEFRDDPFILRLKELLGETFLSLMEFEHVNKFTVNWKNGSKEEILREFSGEYELMFHGDTYIEGVPKGFSKASGIKWLCDYLQIDRKDTYAFGDSVNDLEMLRYVQNGIAMGNATEEAKKAADYVTATVNEDGIYRGLKHFSLI